MTPRPGSTRPSALPLPDEEALAHSQRLVAHIIDAIGAAGGAIDFARYMELSLYAPGLGYYSAGSRKLGPEGDFITAPEISPLFGRCIARQCADLLREMGTGDVLELGAGSGALAVSLLAELERLGQLPERYCILEVSAELRSRQQDCIARELPHLADRVSWLDELPQPIRGVIIANEVLDAMAVHRFILESEGVSELCVAADEQGAFRLERRPAGPHIGERAEAIRRRHGLAPGYCSEINLAAEALVCTLADRLERGAVLLIDYGFPAHEFYHPHRAQGTLMCHYRHRTHDDALFLPGLQDITAHVDFTAIAEAAHASGLRVAGFTNQGHFLLGCGLAEVLGEMPEGLPERLTLSSAIRRLTSPEEMGELFKVLALTRDISSRMRGFLLRDDRHRL